MKLKSYVDDILGVDVSKAARNYANSTGRDVHIETFRTWYSGTAVPRPAEMPFIVEWSSGHVTPNDFFKLPVSQNGAGKTPIKFDENKRQVCGCSSGNGFAVPSQFDAIPSEVSS